MLYKILSNANAATGGGCYTATPAIKIAEEAKTVTSSFGGSVLLIVVFCSPKACKACFLVSAHFLRK
jgi:hypothetical protein